MLVKMHATNFSIKLEIEDCQDHNSVFEVRVESLASLVSSLQHNYESLFTNSATECSET